MTHPLHAPRLRAVLSIAACSTLVAHAWRAGADEGRDPVAAEALFREGRRALEAGDFAQACPKFHESWRLDPSAGALLNLANCEERLGRLADAWEHFRRVVETLPADDPRVAVAKGRVVDLEARLPRLAVVTDGALPPGATVVRDGTPLGPAALGVALPVNPGERVVVVRAPGRRDATFRASVSSGAQARVVVAAGAPLPARPDAPSDDPARARRLAGFVLGGVGVAGLVVGAVAGVAALDAAATVDDPAHCDAALRCDADGVAAARRGSTWATVSTVAFAASAVGIGAGAALIVTSRPRWPSAAGVGARATTSLGVAARSNGVSLDLRRSF